VIASHRGLQTWQKLRVEELLRARLDGNVTTRELASACSVSMRHFARGFRRSSGTSVREHRVRLRIEQARSLLTAGGACVAQTNRCSSAVKSPAKHSIPECFNQMLGFVCCVITFLFAHCRAS
jgi:AraC-like DNA-binding protein